MESDVNVITLCYRSMAMETYSQCSQIWYSVVCDWSCVMN